MSGGFACLFRIRHLLAFALLGFGTGDVAHAAKGLFQNFLVQLAHPVAKGGRHKQLAAVLGILQQGKGTAMALFAGGGVSPILRQVQLEVCRGYMPGDEPAPAKKQLQHPIERPPHAVAAGERRRRR